jgi:signal transduction histidine kinase
MNKAILLTLISSVFATCAYAGGKEDAVKMASEAAVAIVKDKAGTIAEINKPKGRFIKGETYVFVLDMTGVVLANPTNAKLIGKNLLDFPDASGKTFRKEIIDGVKASGTATVEYKYKNPISGTIEDKVSYCKLAAELAVCSGYYK